MNENKVVFAAEAHKHDTENQITFEANLKLIRLVPKNCPVQMVFSLDNSNQVCPDEEGDYVYTYMSYPSMCRLSWSEVTARKASDRLRSLNLECFKVTKSF